MRGGPRGLRSPRAPAPRRGRPTTSRRRRAAALSTTPASTATASAPSTTVMRASVCSTGLPRRRPVSALPYASANITAAVTPSQPAPPRTSRGVGGGQRHGCLHGDVGGQQRERDGDDAQRAALAGLVVDAAQLPDDDRGREYLDQRVDAEGGERNRAR